MTDELVATEALTLDDLDYFYLANGLPCFIGNLQDICDIVEGLGFQVYYVVATKKFSYEEGTTTKVTKTGYAPSVFKVVTSIVSRAVVVADPAELSFDTLEPTAWFTLPRIPYELVKKMDDFFRAVHDKYHTESIVLLTYDPDFLEAEIPSQGWGILVPDQTNTAADCSYEPESIVDDKPEHVYIVGSAHSHPEMSAYASGTDHKDQADFDGVHITYGWRKNMNNGATEYHIELQVQGHPFLLTPEQVFEDRPLDPPAADVETWVEKVSKKTYNTTTTTSSGYMGVGSGSQGYAGGTSSYGNYGAFKPTAPPGCPSLDSNTVIAELLSPNEKKCPWCETTLLNVDIDKRRCMACHAYVCLPGETLEEIFEARTKSGVITYEMDVARKPFKPIIVWRRETNGADSYEPWYTPEPKESNL